MDILKLLTSSMSTKQWFYGSDRNGNKGILSIVSNALFIIKLTDVS